MTASKIEWTDRSDWNPIRGCNRVSPGCGGPGDHGGCYAESMAARFSKPGQWGHGFAEMKNGRPRWTGKVALAEDRLLLPLRWKKPAKVFVSSTSDVFHEALSDADIDRIFAVMAQRPHLTFQILTKRPDRMRAWFANASNSTKRRDEVIAAMYQQGATFAAIRWPLPNVWLGTSVEDQPRARERLRELLNTPAKVHFISGEPLLGHVDLRQWLYNYGCPCGWGGDSPDSHCDSCGENHREAFEGDPCPKCKATIGEHQACPECGNHCCEGNDFGPNSTARIDWVIAGGESGPRARPMHPDWARALRDQCAAAGVPFFFKQWGEWAPGEIAADHLDPERSYIGRSWNGDTWHDVDSPPDGHIDDEPDVYRVGKGNAGRTLDGRTHEDFPATGGPA